MVRSRACTGQATEAIYFQNPRAMKNRSRYAVRACFETRCNHVLGFSVVMVQGFLRNAASGMLILFASASDICRRVMCETKGTFIFACGRSL